MTHNSSLLAFGVKESEAIITNAEKERGVSVNSVYGVLLCRCCNKALKVHHIRINVAHSVYAYHLFYNNM